MRNECRAARGFPPYRSALVARWGDGFVDTIGRQVTAFVTMFMAAGLIILMYMIFEPQRQAAASNEQIHAASERGAELFAENCIVCHGTDGLGKAGAGFPLN